LAEFFLRLDVGGQYFLGQVDYVFVG